MSLKALIRALALAAVLLLTTLPAPAGEGPRIDVPRSEIDAGILRRGEIVDARYTLRNTGTEDLRLISAESHCPCIETAFSGTTIPPGGEGTLDVRFTASTGAGATVSVIELTTSDPERRTISLTFRARVDVPFGFEERTLDIGRIHHEYDETLTREAALLISDSSAAEPAGVESSSPLVTARLTGDESESEGHRRLIVAVTVLPGLPPGTLSESVTVHSGAEGVEPAILGVTGLVTGDVTVSPRELRLLVVETARRTAQDSWVRAYLTGERPDRSLKILATRDSNGILGLELTELIPGAKYELTVTLAAEALEPDSAITGVVEVTTNSPSQPVITVPYSAGRRRYDKLDQAGDDTAGPGAEAPQETAPAGKKKEPAKG